MNILNDIKDEVLNPYGYYKISNETNNIQRLLKTKIVNDDIIFKMTPFDGEFFFSFYQMRNNKLFLLEKIPNIDNGKYFYKNNIVDKLLGIKTIISRQKSLEMIDKIIKLN